MTNKDLGKFLVEAGVFMLVLPIIAIVFILIAFAVSIINFTTTSWIILGILIYLSISISLIYFGNRMINK